MVDTEKIYEIFYKAGIPVVMKTNGQGTYIIATRENHPVRKEPLSTTIVDGIDDWKETCDRFIQEWRSAYALDPRLFQEKAQQRLN